MSTPHTEPRPTRRKSGPPPSAFLGWVGEIVHAHRARLVRVARREGLRGEDALDCVQDAFHTFLLIPQARMLAEHADDSLKLITVIVRNEARNARRRHAVSRPHSSDPSALEGIPSDQRGVDEIVEVAEEHVRMIGCMHRLKDVQRSVVTLRMLDEIPGEDVARQLGLAPGHVAVLLQRAKHDLRTCMS